MSKKNIIICALVTLVGIGVVVAVLLSQDKPAEQSTEISTSGIIDDTDFTWKVDPAETLRDINNLQEAADAISENTVEEKPLDSEVSAEFTHGGVDVPQEIFDTPGYKAFEASEFYREDQQWACVERGNMCEVIITGDYYVSIEWYRDLNDCAIFVIDMSDHNNQLAFFGLDI